MPLSLGSVGGLHLCPRLSLGLPLCDQGPFGIDIFSHKEKDKKIVDGNTSLSHLGNLEGEEPYSL